MTVGVTVSVRTARLGVARSVTGGGSVATPARWMAGPLVSGARLVELEPESTLAILLTTLSVFEIFAGGEGAWLSGSDGGGLVELSVGGRTTHPAPSGSISVPLRSGDVTGRVEAPFAD